MAAQLWGRRVALAAMGLAAVYIPLIIVGGAVMSEPLFAALLLGALAAVIQHRRSTHRWRWVLLAGVLGGLTILTRANALVLLLPLGLAVWTGRPRFSPRALAAPAVLVVLALLHGLAVDDPQRGRLRPLHPGLDPARLGARRHLQRPGARGQGEPRLVALDRPRPGLPGAVRAR